MPLRLLLEVGSRIRGLGFEFSPCLEVEVEVELRRGDDDREYRVGSRLLLSSWCLSVGRWRWR